MIVSRIILKNWRNFRSVDVRLGNRMFLVGPNASGKSNFLDVFRFLHDIVKPGGGFLKAIADRKGASKIRCLAARQNPDLEIEVHLAESRDQNPLWKYSMGIKQETSGARRTLLSYERVWYKKDKPILNRPDSEDRMDLKRLTETHLQNTNSNKDFREIADFFESTTYLHLVPQLLRYPGAFSGPGLPEDPFGLSFLERVTKTPLRVRKSRLRLIESALQVAVPQLKRLTDAQDKQGIPHLEALYEHWRPKGAKQQEDQLSDGTLRLIGLLWSLLESDSLLLLEEPELSLHSRIVRELPALIYRLQRYYKKKKVRQILLSTHSFELLSEVGIGANEVLLLKPTPEGTEVFPASSDREIRSLLEGGMSIADAVIPKTAPKDIHQLTFKFCDQV